MAKTTPPRPPTPEEQPTPAQLAAATARAILVAHTADRIEEELRGLGWNDHGRLSMLDALGRGGFFNTLPSATSE